MKTVKNLFAALMLVSAPVVSAAGSDAFAGIRTMAIVARDKAKDAAQSAYNKTYGKFPKAPEYSPVKAGIAFGTTLVALGLSTKAAVKFVKWIHGTKAAAKVKALFKRNKAKVEVCEAPKAEAFEAETCEANAKPAPRVRQAKPIRVAAGYMPNRNAARGGCVGGQCNLARGGCANGQCSR